MESFTVRAVDLNEAQKPAELAPQYAGRIAKEKAQKALREIQPQDPEWILTADTIVYIPSEPTTLFGKPASAEEAKRFLRLLSGKPHEVLTAFCLVHVKQPEKLWVDRLVRSTVHFRRLHDSEIHAYVATNEWKDKAGGYGIQDKGAFLVDTIEGSHSNIVGLPVTEVIEGFKTLGIPGWWLS